MNTTRIQRIFPQGLHGDNLVLRILGSLSTFSYFYEMRQCCHRHARTQTNKRLNFSKTKINKQLNSNGKYRNSLCQLCVKSSKMSLTLYLKYVARSLTCLANYCEMMTDFQRVRKVQVKLVWNATVSTEGRREMSG